MAIEERKYSVKGNREYNFSLEEYNKLQFPGKVRLINKEETMKSGEPNQIFSIDGTIINLIYSLTKGTFAKIKGEPKKVKEFRLLLEKMLGAKLEEI